MTTTSEFDMRYSPNRPTPYDFDALWDSNHVKMPCSTKNRIYSPSNVAKPIRRWDIIRSKLQGRTFQSVAELEKVIRSYNPTYASKWGPFTALNKLATLDPNFLTKTLPYIIGMAMAIDAWFFQPIPLLRAQSAKTLIFSQAQCVSLIANMFLCTFPRRAPRHWTKKNEYSDFPDVSFDGLFTRDEDTALAKLQCFVGYFNAHMSKLPGSPDREVRFTRKVLGGLNVLKWSKCNASLSRFQVVPNAGLETMNGMWQADFANKMIGGGVLGRGAVQEEIRFSISPELLVSRLFTQELQDNEALLMTGSQQYVSYSGYAQSFRLKEPYEDIAVIKRGLVTKVIALDALTYENSNPLDQFTASDTIRELNKAYIAFSASCESEAMEPVATGRWGCGVFKGNASWKFLIQLLACSAAGRPMTFCTMNDNPLTGSLSSFCQFLDSLPTRPTVQSVYRIMASFQPSSDSDDVLPFIMHHLALKPTPLQSHGQYASAGMGAQATSYGAVQYHSPIGLPIGGTHHPGSPAYPQSLSQSSPSYMSQGPQHYSQAGSGMMHAQPQSVRLLGVTGPPTLASSRQNADMGSSQHFDMRSAPYISHTVASPARVRSSPLETSYHHPSAQYQHKLYQGSTASHSPYDHGHHMSPGPVAYPPPSTVPQSYLSSPSQPYPQNSSDWNQQTYESHPSGGNLRSSGHFQHRGQGNY
jgi:poly(ADP-ribose) glycohydrolase